jgi:vacuolar-type H+-ATPase subunit F/Vma7
MHAGTSGNINGWDLSSGGITAEGGMTWDNSKVDNIFTDPTINDAQFAVLMMNVHDINYVGQRIDQFIAAGIVPIISTIPPRDHPTYNTTHAQPYNAEVRTLAQQKKIPLIDYWEEILLRRPGTSWINSIIGPDGVHPSGNEYVDPASDPYAGSGDASTHTTGDAPLNSGYLLRTWLTVQKLKEIKQNAVD